jgi:general secretion pathway protein K
LLAALLVAALATLLATRLLAVEDNFLSLVHVERDIAQTRRLALAGLDFARAILNDDARRSSVDHLDEPWATVIKEMPAESGSLSGHLADAQARFNLGSLLRDDGSVDMVALTAYEHMLELLGLDRRLGEALAVWLKSRQQGLPLGTRQRTDIDELRQIEGYSDTTIDTLGPYVISLPVATPVNLNTAAPLVLAAVAGLGLPQARMVEAARRTAWFRDAADFKERSRAASGESRLWGIQSNFFEATVEARQGRARTRLRALLHRHSGQVDVLALQFGT